MTMAIMQRVDASMRAHSTKGEQFRAQPEAFLLTRWPLDFDSNERGATQHLKVSAEFQPLYWPQRSPIERVPSRAMLRLLSNPSMREPMLLRL